MDKKELEEKRLELIYDYLEKEKDTRKTMLTAFIISKTLKISLPITKKLLKTLADDGLIIIQGKDTNMKARIREFSEYTFQETKEWKK